MAARSLGEISNVEKGSSLMRRTKKLSVAGNSMSLRQLGELMGGTKRIVCLANSRKLSGRCVAGIEIVDSQLSGWIRPVSVRQSHEVSEIEREYRDGSDPQVLDIV